jgi:molybdenum cofactor guanylyltransferase
VSPAAIVLAGGRSSRFGSDKLKHRIAGRTLLERTLDAAAEFFPIVLVSPQPPPPGVIGVCEFPRWGGPAAALAAGLDALPAGVEETVIIPADLADPRSAVQVLLGMDIGVPIDDQGRPQWLLTRCAVAPTADRVLELRREGGLAGLPLGAVLNFLPRVRAGRSVPDIDTQDDLARLGLAHGTV